MITVVSLALLSDEKCIYCLGIKGEDYNLMRRAVLTYFGSVSVLVHEEKFVIWFWFFYMTETQLKNVVFVISFIFFVYRNGVICKKEELSLIVLGTKKGAAKDFVFHLILSV